MLDNTYYRSIVTNTNCKLCGNPAKGFSSAIAMSDINDRFFPYSCKTCGNYSLQYVLHNNFNRRFSQQDVMLLRCITRTSTYKGKPIFIDDENYSQILSMGKFPNDPLDGIDNILVLLSEHGSDERQIDIKNDYTLFFASSDEEIHRWFRLAKEIDFIGIQGGIGIDFITLQPTSYRITVNGWKRLKEIKANTNKISKNVFVAMWFDPSMDDIFRNGIEPALTATGYKAIYLNRDTENKLIDDQIIAGIRKSRFIIADFTKNRNGVYYEAGFAAGLGIDVIHTCKEGERDERHFDIEHHPFTYWNDAEDLKIKLIRRIEATIV